MFLSTENPPRDPLPSPSSNLLRLTTTSSSDELGQSHLSNFSIRDYAYSNRKNNIKNSWPFSTKSLQLCSSHGVADPLPPFQTTASSSSGKQIVAHVHLQTIAETSKGVCSQSRIIKNGLFTSTSVSKSKVETVVAATSNKSRKCGRGGGMVKSKEDGCGVGLVTRASESVMASKTCPICKTFSSASNTTLNAHIDQCLSMDSAVPPPVSSKPSKPRVKAQVKVKTLVEIYACAKRCTLEDLDKRNGTQWASVLSCKNGVAADKSQVSKKRKASHVGVGPVYIDAKGQKLRILTEFREKKTCTTRLREQQGDGSSESLSKGSKEKSKSSRKRRRRGKKDCKYIKLTSHKANASEKVHEYQRGFSGEGSSKGPRGFCNQRMLAKRGLVSKKLNEKGHKFYALRDQPSDDDDDDEWLGGDRLVVGRNKSMIESKRAHLNTVHSKKSLASIQEDKYPPGKNTDDASPPATSMGNLSPPFLSNGWRRLSPHVELKRARFDHLSEEEQTGKWESEMTQERELSDDDYVSSGDDNPSFSRYDDDDDDEESSDDSNSRANVLDKSNDARPSSETIPSERAVYYSEQNMMYGQGACDEEDVRFESEVRGKGSLFVEVDTIPIPGPPGSFLPSPRGMGFDENLGNSSVVTSQFQDQLDRNSSESPVSNFPAGRLNFQAAELPSSLDIPSSYSATPVTIPEAAEPMSVDKETPSRFRNKGHYEPCRCQSKERISEGITLNHEASNLLQRRAASSSSSSIAINLTESPTLLDPNHHPFEQSPYMIQQEFDLHRKLLSNRANMNGALVPPSPSNSVLRLMGKDLMVIMNQGEADNKEEASRACLNPTPQFHHDPQPCAGTGFYFNTGLYLRNSFESSHQQPQTPVSQQQTQASPFRSNFDHVRYFSPS